MLLFLKRELEIMIESGSFKASRNYPRIDLLESKVRDVMSPNVIAYRSTSCALLA